MSELVMALTTLPADFDAKALAQGANVQVADVVTVSGDPDSAARSYSPPDEVAPLAASDPGDIEIVVQARVTCKF